MEVLGINNKINILKKIKEIVDLVINANIEIHASSIILKVVTNKYLFKEINLVRIDNHVNNKIETTKDRTDQNRINNAEMH